jgi:hypothetical protein
VALIIEAPNEVYSLEASSNKKLFLAGGISDCPDWQEEVIERIKDYRGLTIYNPRRKLFPIHDINAAEEQITWEHYQLDRADVILFWFSRGSMNPIVLYELGRWGNSSKKPIILGIDPEYERMNDVIIQTKLSRADITPVFSIRELCGEIKKSLYRQ